MNKILFLFILVANLLLILFFLTFFALGVSLSNLKIPKISFNKEFKKDKIEENKPEDLIEESRNIDSLRDELVKTALGFCYKEDSLDCSYPAENNYCLTDYVNCSRNFVVEENYVVLLNYLSATRVCLYLDTRRNLRENIYALENGMEANHMGVCEESFYNQLESIQRHYLDLSD